MKRLLTEQVEHVRTLERRTGRTMPYLFLHLRGRRRGTRIQDFKRRWQTACEEADLMGKLRHDFRRTAVRNMVNAGIPGRVAMTISGHNTRWVFDRYHIVSPGDLRQAAEKLTGMTAGITPGQTPERRPGRPRKNVGRRPMAGRRSLAR